MSRQILIIEPDQVLARSICQAVVTAGYLVHWQARVQAALNALDHYPIALIVLELQLAQHNGVEFLYEVRSYPEWGSIPVVVHTAVPQSVSLGSPKFWQDLGVVRHLYKPQTTMAQLVQVINRSLPEAETV